MDATQGSPDPSLAGGAERRLLNELESALKAEANDRCMLPDTLCHYTTAEGMIGILESGTIHFTHAGFLNDSSEVSYGTNVIRQGITEELARADSDAWSKFLTNLSGYCVSVWELLDCFVACFCKDSDRLSQWRSYGLVSGYCLEFRTERLLWEYPPGMAWTGFKRMIYQPPDQRALVSRTLERFRPAVDAHNGSASMEDPALSALFNAVVPLILSLKHPAFAEEGESRFIALAWRFADPVQSLAFRSRSGMIVPYMPVGVAAGLPLQVIRHGPHPEPAITKHYLTMVAERYGYSVSVEGSNVPLRS